MSSVPRWLHVLAAWILCLALCKGIQVNDSTISFVAASYGPALYNLSVPLYIPEQALLCGERAPADAANFSNKAVLILRGSCAIIEKLSNSQTASAAAVILGNPQPYGEELSSLVRLYKNNGPFKSTFQSTTPLLLISYSNYAQLRSFGEGTLVNLNSAAQTNAEPELTLRTALYSTLLAIALVTTLLSAQQVFHVTSQNFTAFVRRTKYLLFIIVVCTNLQRLVYQLTKWHIPVIVSHRISECILAQGLLCMFQCFWLCVIFCTTLVCQATCMKMPSYLLFLRRRWIMLHCIETCFFICACLLDFQDVYIFWHLFLGFCWVHLAVRTRKCTAMLTSWIKISKTGSTGLFRYRKTLKIVQVAAMFVAIIYLGVSCYFFIGGFLFRFDLSYLNWNVIPLPLSGIDFVIDITATVLNAMMAYAFYVPQAAKTQAPQLTRAVISAVNSKTVYQPAPQTAVVISENSSSPNTAKKKTNDVLKAWVTKDGLLRGRRARLRVAPLEAPVPGSHSFVRLQGQNHLRVGLYAHADFGQATAHLGLMSGDLPVISAGQVEVGQNGEILRWSNRTNELVAMVASITQAGLPIDKAYVWDEVEGLRPVPNQWQNKEEFREVAAAYLKRTLHPLRWFEEDVDILPELKMDLLQSFLSDRDFIKQTGLKFSEQFPLQNTDSKRLLDNPTLVKVKPKRRTSKSDSVQRNRKMRRLSRSRERNERKNRRTGSESPRSSLRGESPRSPRVALRSLDVDAAQTHQGRPSGRHAPVQLQINGRSARASTSKSKSRSPTPQDSMLPELDLQRKDSTEATRQSAFTRLKSDRPNHDNGL